MQRRLGQQFVASGGEAILGCVIVCQMNGHSAGIPAQEDGLPPLVAALLPGHVECFVKAKELPGVRWKGQLAKSHLLARWFNVPTEGAGQTLFMDAVPGFGAEFDQTKPADKCDWKKLGNGWVENGARRALRKSIRPRY